MLHGALSLMFVGHAFAHCHLGMLTEGQMQPSPAALLQAGAAAVQVVLVAVPEAQLGRVLAPLAPAAGFPEEPALAARPPLLLGPPAPGLPALGLPPRELPAWALPALEFPAPGPPALGFPPLELPALGLPALGPPALGPPALGLPPLDDPATALCPAEPALVA